MGCGAGQGAVKVTPESEDGALLPVPPGQPTGQSPPGSTTSSLRHLEVVPKDSPAWGHICQLFHVPDPENLGVGRDVKAKEQYNAIRPLHAWKIDVKSHAAMYDTAQKMVIEDYQAVEKLMGIQNISTKLDSFGALLGQDDEDKQVNDRFLLHGTKPELLRTILRNGLSEKFSGGLLGKGLYLAEDVSKIDQYCTPDPGLGADGLAELHADLYSKNGLEHPGYVFYALVCRATLGIPVYTKDGEVNMHRPSQKLFADSDKRELTSIPDSDPPVHYHTLIAEVGKKEEGFLLTRQREFVVFNSNRVLEEFIVVYRREMDPTITGHQKQVPAEVEIEQHGDTALDKEQQSTNDPIQQPPAKHFDEASTKELLEAATRGNVERVETLIRAGANIEGPHQMPDVTPLIMTAWNGHTGAMRLLLEASADREQQEKRGRTALMMAADQGQPATAELLASTSSNPNDVAHALLISAKKGKDNVTKVLIDCKANLQGPHQMPDVTPLIMAAWNGHIGPIKLLLEARADREQKEKRGRTPLMMAADQGQPATAEVLACTSNSPDDVAHALLISAEKGKDNATKVLIDCKANLEGPHQMPDVTPLMMAATNGHVGPAKFLLEAGADREAKERRGRTALDLAKERNNMELVELLEVPIQSNTR